MLLLQSIYGHPVTSSMARPCVLQHELFGSDNHFGLGFCVFIAGWRKKEPKGSSSFLHHDYFGLESLVRTSQNFLDLKNQAGLGFRVLLRI